MTALVLYDSTGPWGWLGELYGMGVLNLASHFGERTAKPVTSYMAGELNSYTAAIYLGSTYNEPLPSAFISDVLSSSTPVVWCGYNVWQLAGASFTVRYGWDAANSFLIGTGPNGGDGRSIDAVQYKGAAPSVTTLTRFATNYSGILNPTIIDSGLVRVLATAVLANGSPPLANGGNTFPWAIRSANLTYVGEIPLTYMKEEDRYLIFADLLFDALAPQTTVRRRALVRFEDLNPESDPARLRAAADYLASRGIPFGFGVSSWYRDPNGVYNDGTPVDIHLAGAPSVVSAMKYLQSKSARLVEHGYSHQWSGGINPYNQVTGDDFEFFRVTENPDHTLNFVGPLPDVRDDSDQSFAAGRISGANSDFAQVGLGTPRIFEFPHYAGSVPDYRAVSSATMPTGKQFNARWERSLYYGNLLNGGPIDYSRQFGQMFPYVVNRDIYESKVLPENLGSIEPEPFFIFPTRFPADLINAASKNLVLRDGFAAFYFHPDFVSLSYLKQTVQGILNLGYRFVDPASL
jgi:uncharacterized protein YdaL